MTISSLIRVMIVDDNKFVRRALVTTLRQSADFKMVGEATNGQDAVRLCEGLQPDVVLMDINMPIMDGVTATQIIHKKYPNVQIIILSNLDNKKIKQDALQAGAIMLLEKGISVNELYSAIHTAYDSPRK
jgi:two-component system, NarL family, response regulator LiaR